MQTQTLERPSLDELKKAYQEQATLSVYLPIRPGLNMPQSYRAELLDLLRAGKERAPETLRNLFASISARVVDYVRDDYQPSGRTLALFAAEAGPIRAIELDLQLPGLARLTDGCFLAPLAAAIEDNPVVLIACVDQRADRIIVASLGELTSSAAATADVPPRQRQGGWAAFRYESDRAQHVQAHVAEFAGRVAAAAREHRAAWIVLGGADELLNVVKQELPEDLRPEVAGTIKVEMFASDNEILEAGLVVAAAAEAQQEKDLATRIIEREPTGTACLGWGVTRNRLAAGRVHELALPVRLLGTEEADNLLNIAWETDARVEFIGPAAEAMLQPYGGVGAILRY